MALLRGIGADEQALGAADRACGIGSKLEAFASGFALALGSGMDQVALVKLGLGVFAT